jgi:hypothetical protein
MFSCTFYLQQGPNQLHGESAAAAQPEPCVLITQRHTHSDQPTAAVGWVLVTYNRYTGLVAFEHTFPACYTQCNWLW